MAPVARQRPVPMEEENMMQQDVKMAPVGVGVGGNKRR